MHPGCKHPRSNQHVLIKGRLTRIIVVPVSKLQSNAAVTTDLFMQGLDLAKEKYGKIRQASPTRKDDDTCNRVGEAPEMETPKTLEQGCATQVFAALCPNIGGMVLPNVVVCDRADRSRPIG